MALSYSKFTADGVGNVYPLVFPFLDKGHIKGQVDGEEVNLSVDTYYKRVTVTPLPKAGSLVVIRRRTPRDRTYSNFTGGNPFGQVNVNNSFLWQLYISQEIAEGDVSDEFFTSNDLDMGGHRVFNLGIPKTDTDAVRVKDLDAAIDKLGDMAGSSISELPPADKVAGRRWTRCSDMKSFIWYVDNNGAQWVEDNPSMGGYTKPAAYYGTVAQIAAGQFSIGDRVTVVDMADRVVEIVSGGTANGFDVLAAGSGRTAVIIVTDVVDVEKFGFTGVGTDADTDRLIAAVEYARAYELKLYCRKREEAFKISKPVNFSGIEQITFLSDINTSLVIAQIPVILGGYANGGATPVWRFSDVTNGTSTLSPTPALPIIRVSGVKDGEIHIGNCNYLQVYADANTRPTSSNAYTKAFFKGIVRRLEITAAAGFSWNTENWFSGGRVIEYYVRKGASTYPHNRNFLSEATFEGADVDIKFEGVTSNYIIGARFENTTAATLYFDGDSLGNEVTRAYTGTGQSRSMFETTFIQITDLGKANNVTGTAAVTFNQTKIFSLNAGTTLVANATHAASDSNHVLPNFTYKFNGGNIVNPSLSLLSVTANSWLGLSDLIPVQFGDAVSFNINTPSNILRMVVFVYDINQRLLTSEGGNGIYWSQAGLGALASDGSYSSSSASASGDFIGSVARGEVKYLRVGIWASAAGSVRNASAILFSKTVSNTLGESIAQSGSNALSLKGAPTKGYLPAFTLVRDITNDVGYKVAYQHESILSLSENAGATSLTVTAALAIANGDVVGVLLDSGLTHWSVVSDLAVNSFTVSALPSPAAVGSRVVFNRWTVV